MSFLIETVIEEFLDAISRIIARRFGVAGCVIVMLVFAVLIGLLIWAIA